MSVKEFIIRIKDRHGDWEVVSAKHALELEEQLSKAKALLKEMALLLIPPPGTNLVEIMKAYLEDVKILDFIEEYGLRISRCSSKAKIDRGQEWAVQDEHYVELFERPTLEEAVLACVKKLQEKAPSIYVDNLLTKEL